MNKTNIEWTNYSWNPITGCLHGCWYCYAKRLAKRFPKIFPNGFNPTFYPERLKEPWELKKPSKIFVCSIADLFASWTLREWRDRVFENMLNCPIQHQWQLLTKSPEGIPKHPFPENWWLGATVTCEEELWKIDVIRGVGCGVRFISFEPLLGKMEPNLQNIDWVIIGKLTGSKRIQLQKEWVIPILAECDIWNIPVFMKNNLVPTFSKGALTQEFPTLKGEG